MVRPRLVEEGVPIGSTSQTLTKISTSTWASSDGGGIEGLENDHFMEDHNSNVPIHSASSFAPDCIPNSGAATAASTSSYYSFQPISQPQHHNHYQHPHQVSEQCQSSLFKATNAGQQMSRNGVGQKKPILSSSFMHATRFVIGQAEVASNDDSFVMEDDDDTNVRQDKISHSWNAINTHRNMDYRQNHRDHQHHLHLQLPPSDPVQYSSTIPPLQEQSLSHTYRDTLRYSTKQPQQQYTARPLSTNAAKPNTVVRRSLSHAAASAAARPTHIEIGADTRATEKMQGVEDHSVKAPLIVMDGANVAYAYANAMQELLPPSKHNINSYDYPHHYHTSKLEPNVRGLRVAANYFADHFRILVVLPQSYYRRKPPASMGNQASSSRSTSTSIFIPQQDDEQLSILEELHRQGQLVAAPPADDDDAYALSIARRENLRAAQRSRLQSSNTTAVGPAYVLSNDLFRDAQERDGGDGSLRQWLVHGLTPDLGPGRVSFAFCDLGRLDDHGDPELDIVPNPRHPLVTWLDAQHRQQQQGWINNGYS